MLGVCCEGSGGVYVVLCVAGVLVSMVVQAFLEAIHQ